MIPRRNIRRLWDKALSQPGYAYKAFRRRLASYLTYYLYDGYSAWPETISLLLTYRCNLRCRMCGLWGPRGSLRRLTAQELKQELSVEEIKKLIEQFIIFSPTITLFGGEPLLNKNWPQVVTQVKNQGLRCNLVTNATLLETEAPALVERGVDEIIFSLDGPSQIHDEIRSAPGTFDKAYRGLELIKKLKREKNRKTPILNINSAIFETNYRHLAEMVRVAEDLEAKTITFHHLIFISQEIYHDHNQIFSSLYGVESDDWGGFVWEGLPRIDAHYLLKEMEGVRRKSNNVRVSFYPNYTPQEIISYYHGFEFMPRSYRPRCLSPWMVAYIFPDGSVRPCLSLNLSLGNIKDRPFSQIWNSNGYKNFRRDIKRRGYFPVCPKCTEFYRF